MQQTVRGIMQFDMGFVIHAAISSVFIFTTIFLLYLLMYNPIKEFLEKRAERIQKDLDTASGDKKSGQTYKADYAKFMQEVEKEKEKILNEAHRSAVEEGNEIVTVARDEARRLRLEADEDIKAGLSNAADDIRTQIVELSALMANQFVEVSIDEKMQHQYVDEALADWSGQR
jgi:F-type H+-transporting ATPase subunit b